MQRSRWQFQAMVSHKLRTPLISMLTGMDLLANYAEELSTAEVNQLAEQAIQGVERLRRTIDEILKQTGTSAIPQPGLNQAFTLPQLQPLVAEICQDLELAQVTISVAKGLENHPVPIGIAQPAMKLILREVLENAKKFHPAGTPAVTIHVSPSGFDLLNIRIIDDGVTLSPEQLTQVWTPYYQGEKYFTGEVAGMGLGLSMVASTIWSMGGTCHMYNNNAGPGITVELLLPLENSPGNLWKHKKNGKGEMHNGNY